VRAAVAIGALLARLALRAVRAVAGVVAGNSTAAAARPRAEAHDAHVPTARPLRAHDVVAPVPPVLAQQRAAPAAALARAALEGAGSVLPALQRRSLLVVLVRRQRFSARAARMRCLDPVLPAGAAQAGAAVRARRAARRRVVRNYYLSARRVGAAQRLVP